MNIDQELLNLIEILSRKVSRRYWSESSEDLTQDGIVLVLELYRKRPNADREWIFKALHNFYASKRKKLRRYETRRVDEDSVPEAQAPQEKEEEISDMDLEMVQFLVNEGYSRGDIIKYLDTSSRTLYTRLKKVRDQ